MLSSHIIRQRAPRLNHLLLGAAFTVFTQLVDTLVLVHVPTTLCLARMHTT